MSRRGCPPDACEPCRRETGASDWPRTELSRRPSETKRFLDADHPTGDWKLIATGDDGPWELYDLGKDRSEQNNVAAVNPDLASRLSAKWKAVDDEFTRTRESAPASTKELMQRG